MRRPRAPFQVWKSRYIAGTWCRMGGGRMHRFDSWAEAMGLTTIPDTEITEPCS